MENKKWETGIDILKIMCMLFIVFTHINWSNEQRKLLLFPFWIDMAVPILMIITGYNYYNSFNKPVTSPKRKLTKNLQRILIPFSVTMFLQYCALSIYEKDFLTPLKHIIKGGYGPGGYYSIVMIQVILLFPFIFKIIKKFKHGFIIIVVANILLEFIWSFFPFLNGTVFERYSNTIYRLLAFRYFGVIAIGAWYAKLADKNHQIYKLRYIIGIIGFILIYLWQYKEMKTYIFDNEWAPTTLPCIFLAFAYFLLIKEINIKTYKIITVLSKSTFHIYLFQMCYFGFITPIIYKIINEKVLLFNIILSIPICFFGGYLFYKSEQFLRQKFCAYYIN